MRRTVREPFKSIYLIAAGSMLSVLLLVSGRALLQDEVAYVCAFAYASEPDRYEVRYELLLEAMERIGACTPEEAADIWANGLKMRSGAAQYSVMDAALKREYGKQLEENAPMWVTGVSSPWIETYRTVLVQKPEESREVRHLMFTTQTSAGPGPTYTASLTLEKEGGYWRIVKIQAEKGLEAYTGFDA